MNNTNTQYFEDVIPYLVDYYEQFGSLPTKAIECIKGTGAYTAFGQNLKNKVEKAGGIEALLRTFVGRGAKKAEKKPKTVKLVVPEMGIETSASVTIDARPKKRDYKAEYARKKAKLAEQTVQA